MSNNKIMHFKTKNSFFKILCIVLLFIEGGSLYSAQESNSNNVLPIIRGPVVYNELNYIYISNQDSNSTKFKRSINCKADVKILSKKERKNKKLFIKKSTIYGTSNQILDLNRIRKFNLPNKNNHKYTPDNEGICFVIVSRGNNNEEGVIYQNSEFVFRKVRSYNIVIEHLLNSYYFKYFLSFIFSRPPPPHIF